MSRKQTLEEFFIRKPLGAPNSAPVPEPDRVKTGAIAAMSASLHQLTESAVAAARMQEQLKAGDHVVELDVAQIDSSMVRDRLDLTNDPSFEKLVDSIRQSGQQVPILVRRHPADMARYQIAYGHRRVRAAQVLGVRVRAIVRELSDADLVIAQGKENLDRHDLSFIERALFAKRLEDHGFDRATIVAAMSADKADVSRYVSLARSIPEHLLVAIGPAGKIGRARWQALATALAATPDVEARTTGCIGDPTFADLPGEQRFARVLQAVSAAPPSKPAPSAWTLRDGREAVQIQRGATSVRLAIDERVAPDFGDFILSKLPDLYADYEKRRADKGAA